MGWLRVVMVVWGLLVAPTAWAGFTVAVLPFDAGTSDPEFSALSVGLQSMLVTDLAQSGEVTVVERAKLGEIVAELELGQSDLVDPKTAVTIGKLVNASHVVAGAFTVAGSKMRLDARITEVTSGTVTIAKQRLGARDAFFELEKALVDDLLADIGARLTAQGRLAVARNATDFDTFVTYSEGVALYDAERYELAVQALEQAQRSDGGFALAATTLEAIQQARQEVRTRAEQLRITKGEEEFAARSAESAAAWKVANGLEAIRRDGSRDIEDRITAAIVLAQLSRRMGYTSGGMHPMYADGDRFAMRRWGERAYQQYWQLTMSIAPRALPLRKDTRVDTDRSPDEIVAKVREQLFDEGRHRLRFGNCHDSRAGIGMQDREATMLWVPKRDRLDRMLEVLKVGHDCFDVLGRGGRGDRASDYEEGLVAFGLGWLSIGEVERATRLFRTAARLTREDYLLKKIGEHLEKASFVQERLQAMTVGSPAHEAMTLAQTDIREADNPLCEVHSEVRTVFPKVRGSKPEEWPLFLSGVPAWLLTDKSRELSSGPRTSIDEAESVRHYRSGQGDAEEPTVFVLGGAPLGDLTATVHLDFAPASDWYPSSRWCREPGMPDGYAPPMERPTAGLLLGLRDVETPSVCDPANDDLQTPSPTTGLGVLVQDGRLVIAEVTETFPEPDRCSSSFVPRVRGMAVGKVLASSAMKRSKATLTVTVSGGTISASGGGARVKHTLGSARSGFVGLLADGNGYVELARPSLQAR